MDRRQYQQLLGELTPRIRSYLFPGFDGSDAAPTECLAEKSCSIFSRLVGRTAAVEKRCLSAAGGFPSVVAERSLPVVGPLAEEEDLDPNTQEILAEIRRIQEKYHLTIDELELILGYTVRLSPVHITLAGQIFLPDFENREVKMPNISKALYFLFLRHPEGLRYKEVAGHREELLQLYLRVTGRDEPQEIEKSIDLLVDPYGNALNVNASRIKTAFRNVMSDRVARFYYINGAAGDVKKVPLDRDLVIWEH